MTCSVVAEGKIFYEHGAYSIMIDRMDVQTVEKAVKALRNVGVYVRAPRLTI
jgi:nicotinate-nucleotide pyrophosphorylase